MKKIIIICSLFLLISFNVNTVSAVVQPKIYTQGFYTLKELNLLENIIYSVRNNEPYAEGLLMVVDSNNKIQQLMLIEPSSISNTLKPLKSDYKFIIYGSIRLSFS